MKIAVIGSGYVGLVTAVGFALKGHEVRCVDVCGEKVNCINSKNAPIFEQGLQSALEELVPEKISATTDLEKAVNETDACFLCVGTPSKEDGAIDLHFVEKCSEQIGNALKKKKEYFVIVVKSTVLPGTTKNTVLPILEKSSGKKLGQFGLAMNPEFLREGIALKDFLEPDRIVIGAMDENSRKAVEKIYSGFKAPILFTDTSTAEMIKYASNCFLASKISFINQIGNICKELGINTSKVAEGMGLDKRIGSHFLQAGPGFGGSCFPKDLAAMIAFAKSLGQSASMLEATVEINRRQPKKLVELAKKNFPLKGKKIAVLGLAFKPDTDDVRESPAIEVIRLLKKEGAEIIAFDPKAEQKMKTVFPELSCCAKAQEAVDKAEAAIIVTDWKEFSSLNFARKPVFDSRNIFKEKKPEKYFGLHW